MSWSGKQWSCSELRLRHCKLRLNEVARLWCLIKVNRFMPFKVNEKYYEKRYVHTEFCMYKYTVSPLGVHSSCVFSV